MSKEPLFGGRKAPKMEAEVEAEVEVERQRAPLPPGPLSGPVERRGACECDPRNHLVSRTSWRPFGGTKYRIRCQACKREWQKF